MELTPDTLDADFLVVGGSVAGSATALHLARAGNSVLLLDQREFPREKACGEGIMPSGVAALARLGLLDELLTRGKPFREVAFRIAPHVAHASFPTWSPTPWGLGIRRRDLDHFLFEQAARTPGVRILPGTRVRSLIQEAGRVLGVEAQHEGQPLSLRAGLTVGADGLHSTVRRALGWEVGAKEGDRFGITLHMALAGPVPEHVEVTFHPGVGELYVTPLPQGEVLVALLTHQRILRQMAGALDTQFLGYLQHESPLGPLLEGAQPTSQALAMGPLRQDAGRIVGPGVALVGDAAGYLDPLTGGGISHALRSAEWLSGALEAGNPAAYPRIRHSALRAHHALTRSMLYMSAHPAIARGSIGMLGAQPRLFGWLLGVNSGMKPGGWREAMVPEVGTVPKGWPIISK